MNERPCLNINLDSKTFRDFYYLKEELIDFSRKYGIPTAGGKIELTNRIAYYLDTGEVLTVNAKASKKNTVDYIDESTIIEPNFVCSEKHRAFFKEKIGTKFSFNVEFQKWLKTNTGKTYQQAIAAYNRIIKEKKKGKTTIDKQFEYNAYIRDFFEDNKGVPLEDAIKCWRYKKSLQGNNHYQKSDLVALEK